MLDAKPRARWTVLDRLTYALGVGLGSGLSPRAPGTAGSLVVLLLMPLWLLLGPVFSLLVMLAMSVLGIWVCGHTARLMGVHDDGRIVWDEFCGQSLALWPIVQFWCSLDTQAAWHFAGLADIVVAFLSFRLFDIWKPFPIGWLDRQVDGGLGIMLDDILAGMFAGLVVWFWLFFGRAAPWGLVQ